MAEENKEQQEQQEEEQQQGESTETDKSSTTDVKNESDKVDDKQDDKEGDETSQEDKQDKTDDDSNDNKKAVPYERFKEVNDKYKAAKQELDELKGNQSNQSTDEADESSNDANNNEELEKYKTAFNDVFQSKLEAVPDEYKDLIPNGDDLSKFKWIESAVEKGLFETKKPESFGNQGNNPGEEEEQSNTAFIKSLGRKF